MSLKETIMALFGLSPCAGPRADALRREVREQVHSSRDVAAKAVAVADRGKRRSDHLSRMAEEAIRQHEESRKRDGPPHH